MHYIIGYIILKILRGIRMRFFFLGLGVMAILAGVFYFFPQIDLDAANIFYRTEEGFYLKDNLIIKLLYDVVPVFVKLFVVGAILSISIIAFRKKPLGIFGKKEIIYLLLALIIGPGLVVNTVFKEHFGRARPAQIVEFGGSKIFTPAFVMADQCEQNCSFVSGHAAVGFYVFAFALLARRNRKILLSFSLIPGFLVGFARMAQGGHFLSDVLFSGFFTVLLSYFLYMVFFGRNLQPRR